jgi:tyrosyl-tRNA synthetase
MEYIKYVIIPWSNKFELKRKEENGGDKTYETYDELEADYVSGAVHPGDLKPSLAAMLNEILQPVRDHFKNNAEAKALLAQIKQYKVTK